MLNRIELNELSEAVIRLTQEASQQILQIYQQQAFSVTTKKDHSPLTEADLASHRLLSHGLQQLTPQLPILSEESTQLDYEVRKQWSRYWLVDPLDGTKEFIQRNDEFTVNVALIQDNKPVMGVVAVPCQQTIYFAFAGGGAFKLEAGSAQKIHTRRANLKQLSIVASRHHRDPRLGSIFKQFPQHQMVSMGSSLKFCAIAEGLADLYPRIGPTCEWDTGAAQCIVEEAGGKVLTTKGKPLLYNSKQELLNPDFLVVGDGSIPWAEYFISVQQ